MCDCYFHKCKECDTKLPVHLGDYETERNEIEVFCQDHLPNENVRIFTVTKTFVYTNTDGEEEEYLLLKTDPYEPPIGWQMGIRSLTKNAVLREYLNYPNLASKFKVKELK
jgi:hypothetical protein